MCFLYIFWEGGAILFACPKRKVGLVRPWAEVTEKVIEEVVIEEVVIENNQRKLLYKKF